MLELTVMSAAFALGAAIPNTYTCKGENISPPLSWNQPPAQTQSLAIICDDPDAPAGDWVHWIVFNMPAGTMELVENQPKNFKLANGAIQGINDFGRPGYGGPCPPPGKAHRYFFKVYALDTVLQLKPAATKKDVMRAMENHILAYGQAWGTFQR